MSAIVGSQHIGGINTDQRKYSREDEIIFRAIAEAPLIGMMRGKFQKKKVTDTKYIMFEDKYKPLTGSFKAVSGTTDTAMLVSTTTFYTANASNYLQADDLLWVDALQTNQTSETADIAGETIQVLSVSGDYWTGVRNIGAAATTYNVTAASANSLTFQRASNASREGASERVAKSFSIESKYNYIQFVKDTYSVTDAEKDRVGYGEDTLTSERRRCLKDVMRQLEAAMIFGKRDLKTVDGKNKPFMGGLTFFLNLTDADSGVNAWSSTYDLVTGDGSSRIHKATEWTQSKWMQFVEKSFHTGNKRKWGLCGESFLNKLQELYADTIRMTWSENRIGLSIATFEANGNRIDFIREPELDLAKPRDLILVDPEFVKYAYFSKDIYDEPLPRTGAQEEKHEIGAWASIAVQNVLAHSWLTGLAA